MLLLCLAAMPARAIEVLLLWDDSPDTIPPDHRPPLLEDLNPHTQALVNALENEGISVTFSRDPHFDYTGTNPPAAGFDVIIHLNGSIDPGDFGDIFSSSTASTINNFIQQGGGYIGSENNAYFIANFPSSSSLRDFTPIEFDNLGTLPDEGALTITPVAGQESHPIFTGLGGSFSINGTFISSKLRSYGSSPATLLAEDALGNAAVAVRSRVSGRIVGFHHRGNYKGPNELAPTLSDPNVQQLYINAVRWADQRAPRVASIELPSTAVSGDNVVFVVKFTESVTGVNASDFQYVPFALDISGPITVTPVSAKEYEVKIAGASGSGFVQLQVLNDGSIKDESFTAKSLTISGGQDLSEDLLYVDTYPPNVLSVNATPIGAGSGATPTLVIEFDDLMDTGVHPSISLTGALGGNIPLGTGAWASSTQYQIPVGRVLTNNDSGLAAMAITGAKDLVGNVMTPYSASPVYFPPIGLGVSISPSGIVTRPLNGTFTLTVTAVGITGDAVYEWKKDDSSGTHNIGNNAPTFTITELIPEDEGLYYCVVTDNIDSITTSKVTLRVGTALPAAGPWGLAALAGAAACTIAGAVLSGRRRAAEG